jgi:hypothetical protein
MNVYNKTLLNKLKFKFNNFEFIDKNFSQAYQDIFVLTMLNGKKNGTFVEIGAYDGQQISNTYLLEKKFDWTGISIDINDISKSFLKYERTSKLVIQDALTINYEQLFLQNKLFNNIDYLQLDIEPPLNTLNCLKRIPFDKYKFSVITYETEIYYSSQQIRNESRRILKNYGYELIVGNVCNIGGDPFEDWYVHPDLVSKDTIDIIKNSEESNLTPDKIFLN